MESDSQFTSAWLLGRVRIECAGTRLDTKLSSSESLLLVALLCNAGAAVRRDELAYQLWPDLSEGNARATLRRHLYNLQRSLPPSERPWIEATSRTVAWLPVSHTWVDLAEFQRLAAAPETFEEAARLYGGEFAPRLDHEWVLSVRASMALRVSEILRVLILRCSRLDDRRGELYYCDQLLSLDPWREDLVRRSMWLRYALGDRAGALAFFKTFRTRLKIEVDVDPMPETLRCADDLARGSRPSDATLYAAV